MPPKKSQKGAPENNNKKRTTKSASSSANGVSTASPAEVTTTGKDQPAAAITTIRRSIPYEKKPIPYMKSSPGPSSQEISTVGPPALIFTHGASSSLAAPASKHFWDGFVTQAPISGFDGNMNLASRVKMFGAVIEHERRELGKSHGGSSKNDADSGGSLPFALGGRSMGARAAVMSAAALAKAGTPVPALVLVSYPLLAGREIRDQILLDIDAGTDVLFIVGDHDSMCRISQLDKVRQKMKAMSWLVIAADATHGMELSHRTEDPERFNSAHLGHNTGEIAAVWLRDRDPAKREAITRCFKAAPNDLPPGAVWADDKAKDNSEDRLMESMAAEKRETGKEEDKTKTKTKSKMDRKDEDEDEKESRRPAKRQKQKRRT